MNGVPRRQGKPEKKADRPGEGNHSPTAMKALWPDLIKKHSNGHTSGVAFYCPHLSLQYLKGKNARCPVFPGNILTIISLYKKFSHVHRLAQCTTAPVFTGAPCFGILSQNQVFSGMKNILLLAALGA